MRSKPLFSIVYLKFDDPKVGNSLKDKRFHNELDCVQISARTERFPLKKQGKSNAIVERKQFALILGQDLVLWVICKVT